MSFYVIYDCSIRVMYNNPKLLLTELTLLLEYICMNLSVKYLKVSLIFYKYVDCSFAHIYTLLHSYFSYLHSQLAVSQISLTVYNYIIINLLFSKLVSNHTPYWIGKQETQKHNLHTCIRIIVESHDCCGCCHGD